jgi:hypothetical protein
VIFESENSEIDLSDMNMKSCNTNKESFIDADDLKALHVLGSVILHQQQNFHLCDKASVCLHSS